ncbi:unnamed protein product [Paramecium sonneborni]|uniref:WD domain, G-beta repeat protein n=1 Tax=Paramecium sonneborni TaxID=65129 RepID=A0A8S1M4W4_9CILI|nr:unnamed protein product [Paramecium sonneborni]
MSIQNIQKKCIKHNQNAIYLDNAQSNPNMKFLCPQCVTDLKQNLILINDAQQQLQGLQAILLQENEELNSKNLKLLEETKEQLFQFKSTIIRLIEKCLHSLEQQIKIIKQYLISFQNKIHEIPTINIDSFIKQYAAVPSLNYKDIRDLLIRKLSQISMNQLFQQIQEKLNQIDLGTKSAEEIMISLKQKIDFHKQQPKIICYTHNNEAIMIDMNEIEICPKRFACLDCIQEFNAKYSKIQNLYELWISHTSFQSNYLGIITEKFNKQNQAFIKQFENMKTYFQFQISDFSQKLNQNNDDFQNKLENFQSSNSRQLSDFTQVSIIEIANYLSKSKNKYMTDDQLEQDFNSWAFQNEQYLSRIRLAQNQFEIQQNQLQSSSQQQKKRIKIREIEYKNPSIKELKQLEIMNQVINLQINNQLNQTFCQPKAIRLFKRQVSSTSINQQIFRYDLLKQYSIFQQELCQAMEFNYDNSILLAGSNCQIKVYNFFMGEMKFKQLLNEHKKNVVTLNFMKPSTQFISGSDDNLIIIWSLNKNNSWFCQQKLNSHIREIRAVIINSVDDLIISGSLDKTIKFWSKANGWFCSQTIDEHQDSVWGLSLNETENQIISCGEDKIILILEKQTDKTWILFQKIFTFISGCRLCYINDHSFVFQPYKNENMILFQYDNMNRQFQQIDQIKVKGGLNCVCFFPQKLLKQNSRYGNKFVLVDKNGQHVNLIKLNSSGQLMTEQSIDFSTCQVFGTMSNDGEFLVTWDDRTKEFQIRVFNQL